MYKCDIGIYLYSVHKCTHRKKQHHTSLISLSLFVHILLGPTCTTFRGTTCRWYYMYNINTDILKTVASDFSS